MELRITTMLASGDHRAALELCAEAYGTELLRYCRAMVGSDAEAEELLQETLVEAWRAFDRFGGHAGVRAFLYGVARRVCIRHLRKRDRRRLLRLEWLRGELEPAPPPDPSEQLADREALDGALRDLKPGLREAVLLRYQAGLDGRELAQALGISHAAARKRVSLGIGALRQSLRPVLMRSDEDGSDSSHTTTTPDADEAGGDNERLQTAGSARLVHP